MERRANPLEILLFGVLLIVIGVLFLFNNSSLWFIIWLLSVFTLFFSGISEVVVGFRMRQWSLVRFLKIISGLGFGLLICLVPNAFTRILYVLLGWWMLLNSFIDLVNYWIFRRDGMPGVIWSFTKGIVGTLVSIYLIVVPLSQLFWASLLAGLFLILYGFFTVLPALIDLLPTQAEETINRHLSFALPVGLSALLPQRFYLSVDKMIHQDQIQVDNDPYDDEPCDLEVLIYLKSSGPESLGHVDISFEGTIYTYGLHDPKTRKLFGTLGDGVLIIANRNDFIHESVDIDHKTVIVYRLQTAEEQKQIIRSRIEGLLERSTPWQCDAELAFERKEDKASYNDYASRVWKETHGKMVKFTKGPFRTYFVVSTNCVKLADYLIRSKELNLFNMSGVITPGTYIGFLNQELAREDSIVITRKIYQTKTQQT